jgi:release factor glutamine methyltransferase
VLAVDRSPDAVQVARANAERLGLAVDVREGERLEPVRGDAPFDLIASNPPYIPTADLPSLPAEVRKEPRLALDGGADGLDVIRPLVSEAHALLAPGGALVLEVGEGQAASVCALCSQAGYADVGARKDLAGIDRVVYARKTTSGT